MAPNKGTANEMSAWERRKLYWKNVSSTKRSSDAAIKDTKPATRRPVVPQKPKVLSQNEVPKKPEVQPKQHGVYKRAYTAPQISITRSRRAPSANVQPSGANNICITKQNGQAQKRKMSVAEDIPVSSKRPMQPSCRRATVSAVTATSGKTKPQLVPRHRFTDVRVNAPVQHRPSLVQPKRLTDVQVNAVQHRPSLVQPKTPTAQPPMKRRKTNYHEIPSRIETGLKRRVSHMKQPSTPIQKADLPRNKRPSTMVIPKCDQPSTTVQQTLDTVNVPLTPPPEKNDFNSEMPVGTPYPIRRGSYTISRISEESETSGNSDQLNVATSEPATINGCPNSDTVIGSADINQAVEGITVGSLEKKNQEKVENGDDNLETVQNDPPTRQSTRGRKKSDVSSGKAKLTSGEKYSQTSTGNLSARKSKQNPRAVDISQAAAVSLADKDHLETPQTDKKPQRSQGASTRSKIQRDLKKENPTPVKDICTPLKKSPVHLRPTRSSNVVDVSEESSTQATGNVEQEMEPPLLPIKTPKSVLKKQTTSKAMTPYTSNRKRKNKVLLEDSENVPPVDNQTCTEVATPVKSLEIRTKRSKSVSFSVGVDTSRVSITLPKTPRRELSLRQKLESFLDDKGYSVSKHRHLRCFGYELSDRKNNERNSMTPSSSSQGSSPGLRVRRTGAKAKSTLPLTPAKNEKEKIIGVLDDLKALLLVGQPVGEGAEWLKQVEKRDPGFLKEQASYWVVKALLAELEGQCNQAFNIFTQAVDQNAKPSDELKQALDDFVERVSALKGSSREETAEVNAPDSQSQDTKGDSEQSTEKEDVVGTDAISRRSTRKTARKSQPRSERKKKEKRDFNEMFESTVVKYTMQDCTSVQTLNKLLTGTPKVLAVLTPVRRSVRLTRSTGRKMRRSFSVDELPESIQGQL